MIQSIKQGDKLECLICKKIFEVNKNTFVLGPGAEYIVCPHCGIGAQVDTYHTYGNPIGTSERWIEADHALPEEDKFVLVTVDGKPQENINLVGAYFLAAYNKDEGWILEGFEHWQKDFKVTYWRELPSPPDVNKAE